MTVIGELIRAIVVGEIPAFSSHVDEAQAEHLCGLGLSVVGAEALRKGYLSGPKAAVEKLQAAAIRQTLVESRQRATLQKVVETLCRRGITPVLLKGAAIRDWNPRQPSWRVMSDLDLLIKEDRIGDAAARLVDAGFSSYSHLPDTFYTRHYHIKPLYSPDKLVCIELHRAVCRPDAALADRLPTQALFADSEPSQVYPGARILGYHHALMHTLSHMYTGLASTALIHGLADAHFICRSHRTENSAGGDNGSPESRLIDVSTTRHYAELAHWRLLEALSARYGLPAIQQDLMAKSPMTHITTTLAATLAQRCIEQRPETIIGARRSRLVFRELLGNRPPALNLMRAVQQLLRF